MFQRLKDELQFKKYTCNYNLKTTSIYMFIHVSWFANNATIVSFRGSGEILFGYSLLIFVNELAMDTKMLEIIYVLHMLMLKVSVWAQLKEICSILERINGRLVLPAGGKRHLENILKVCEIAMLYQLQNVGLKPGRQWNK